MKKYSRAGKTIKYSDGAEKQYDENGNLIYFKDYKGIEYWFQYNENQDPIHTKDSTGYEQWWTYNNSGKRIGYRNSKGFEEEYD